MAGDAKLRLVPQVQALLERPDAGVMQARFGRRAVTEAVRQVLDRIRSALRDGSIEAVPTLDAMLGETGALLAARSRPHLTRVINATGIVLHTNLGRAPLAAEAVEAVVAVAGHYSNLEYDLQTGARGSRMAGVEALLCELTGAEAALAVNNGAAAILLALAGLAGGGEVIVSRGELVEIGGGFRIPDVIRQGGATLVEVGATNKTRAADYAGAVGERTRVLLKVHQSNFRLAGFTEAASLDALAAIGRAHGVLVVADLGSGLLHATPGVAEPTLRDALQAGADLVTCSGDKLLGGPQAGLLVGTKASIGLLRRHPLLRALRLDKMSLAALEATLRLHRDRPEDVPVRRMLLQQREAIGQRAERLVRLLGMGEVVATEAFAGGGALPEEKFSSFAVALDYVSLAGVLRRSNPPVICRIADGRLIFDMATVAEEEVETLANGIARAARDNPRRCQLS